MPYAIGVADALRGVVGENLERLDLDNPPIKP
jgi:hypothetical protein